MIDKLKLLLDDEDVSDELLNVFIERAVVSIQHYLNNDRFTDEYVVSNFQAAVIALVENIHNSKDTKHLKSGTQGKRSETYRDDQTTLITPEVMRLLPTPYVRML